MREFGSTIGIARGAVTETTADLKDLVREKFREGLFIIRDLPGLLGEWQKQTRVGEAAYYDRILGPHPIDQTQKP